MQLRQLLLKTIVIFSLVGFAAACSDDDADSNNDTPDSGIEAPDASHDHDALGDDDIKESEDGEDGDDGVCEPGSDEREAVARAEVGVNTGVNEGEVSVEVDGDAHIATIDAASGGPAQTATTSFVYLDFDNGEKLELSDVEAFEDADWDIAFNRTMIRLNSADSGPGVWMAARVDAGWDDAEMPGQTDGAWGTDSFVAENCELETEGRDTITTAFGVWFEYDMSTHTTEVPEDTTWFLYNMSNHSILKFEIQSYTDATYTIRWAPVDMGR